MCVHHLSTAFMARRPVCSRHTFGQFSQYLKIFENYNFLLEEQTLIGNYELDNCRPSSAVKRAFAADL